MIAFVRRFTVLALIFGVVLAACAKAQPDTTAASGATEVADLILRGGKVVTVDDQVPEAQAVAIAGDRIIAVGTDAEIDALAGPDTEIVELAGRLAVPGFIDSHAHFMSLGRAQQMLDLTKVKSWDEIVAMVGEAAKQAKPGDWILGRGWHQEKWDEVPEPNVDGVPLHHELSKVSPDNPVNLTHASGHASFVNAKAMEVAGIDKDTRDPPGGTILRDERGRPTGGLREKAQRLVSKARARHEAAVPEAERIAQRRRLVELASKECLENGVTSVHDAGVNFATIDFFRERAEAGELGVRVYAMVRYESNEAMAQRLPAYKLDGVADGFLAVRSIKRQIDGALGAHGAWLLAPYEDLEGNTGLVLETPEDIVRTADLAIQHGFQVNTHAIGDRANREVLDIYAKAFERAGVNGSDLRWRIEHAQHVHPDDVARFKELGVVAAFQGIHCTSDAPYVIKRLGKKRAESTAYLWRTFIDAGIAISNGTDAPVEDVDPIPGFYASVTRKLADETLFYPAQKMTRAEALHSYTLGGAYAAFEEDVKGSISPGKYADIVVLSTDIMTVPDEEILDAKVDMTVLAGRIRYRRDG
jgi:predicted amidohydrolase YtcJ